MAEDEDQGTDWLLQGTSESAEVSQHYDEWAESYDADLASWSYDAPRVVAEIVGNRVPKAASVLDVGCGTGLVGKALRTTGYDGRLDGLDISRRSLDLARQTGAYDTLDAADLQEPLGVRDDAVDAVVCVGVMTYLPEVETVWRELARVVRPGGLLVVTQREDMWAARDCQGVVDRLTAQDVWTTLEVSGPVPYLPESGGSMAELGCYYVTARIR